MPQNTCTSLQLPPRLYTSTPPYLLPCAPQGAIVYHDGQFNDSRLAIMLACTAAAAGATVLNHAEAVKLIKASCSFLSFKRVMAGGSVE